MPKIKILQFTDSLRPGGKERQVVELIKGLSRYDNISVELVTMSEEIHYSEVKKLNVKIHFLIRKVKKDPSISIRLFNICKKIKPQIIHTWGSFPSIYAFPITKMLGIKFVNGTIRKAPYRLKIFGEDWIRSRLTFPFSDAIVSNSKAGLVSYKAPASKSYCIYNGFDFNRLKKIIPAGVIRKRLYLNDYHIIGMVASFTRNKDYETFLKAAQIVLGNRNDVIFLTVGHGPTFNSCLKLVNPQYNQKIKFLGLQEDVESIINTFDIGILATDTKFAGESSANAIMEYMALGKPVIATRCGGNSELLDHNKTGFLIDPFDTNDMELKIGKLLNDRKLRIKMGKAGRERIRKYFNLEKMIRSYVKLYYSLGEVKT